MAASINIIKGDITRIDADAIVNAANASLLGGGGVDGAIHRAGGPQILKECKEIRSRQGECKTGEAVITSAGNMKAKYVIHTVGPVWRGGKNNEAGLLANAYRSSLRLAVEHNCKTVAFPNISTGVYGFPKPEAAAIALETVNAFIKSDEVLTEVIFVCYDDENLELYRQYSDKLK
jgi:O-acetyl-ADP-ribose deacetylase